MSGSGGQRDVARDGLTSLSGTSPMHLLLSEINAVTSAIRKHARNAASSSFLGSTSNASAGISGPVAGGSSTASLMKAAVMAASSTYTTESSLSLSANGAAATRKGDHSQTDQTIRITHARNPSLDNAIAVPSALSPTPPTPRKPSMLRYVYADNRRDDSITGLLNAFTVLRAQLRESGFVDAVPQPLLILPFLRVILSARTTGPVTSISLQAIHRLILYGIIKAPGSSAGENDVEVIASRQDGRDSASYLHKSSSQLAIAEIAHAVSHCRFEASDAITDELVLLRILAVMRELICWDGSAGTMTARAEEESALADHLSDESICEMMETGLSMCCQMRLSDLLRRTAEQAMTAMVRALFAKLPSIPLADDETFSADSDGQDIEPEHATLAADPVGDDALDAENKRLRRMTMPDPQSLDVPAAGTVSSTMLQELKTIGEQEEIADSRRDDSEKETLLKPQSEVLLQGEGEPEVGEDARKIQADEAPYGDDDGVKEDFVHVDSKPYGLPAIKEVLRVIISLLDPQTQQHTDAMRSLGLTMLCSVLEVAGRSIGQFPSLRALVQDSACKHLFTLTRSENTTLVSYSLRTMSMLFETMREHLKLQYELYLGHLLDRLSPTFPISMQPWKEDASNVLALRRESLTDLRGGSGTPDPASTAALPPPPPPPPPLPRSSDRAPAHGETRELAIETMSLLLGLQVPRRDGIDPFVELWVNYDCNVDCENLFENLIDFLCRSIYAANPLHQHVQESTQIFAVDAILQFVSQMTARQEAEAAGIDVQGEWPEDLPSPEDLTSQKETKASILAGAARFNEKPKEGLKYFEQVGFIISKDDPSKGLTRDQSIAKFLKECPGLDKKLLGDYLSRPANEGILDAFLRLFDFSGTPIAEAMREMLEAFRLPGESQQIARITETFANIYFDSKPVGVANQDAVYVLSYSIIMLNTDLHNPQNKRRMSVEDYRKNLRGVNDGKDFDQEFLDAIYDSIRRREIVMPEEHKGQLGFDYTWKELLRRSRKAGGLHCTHTTHFDQAMFGACWRPIVASIAHAFSTFRDEHLLERAIIGFRQCAVLASRFGMYELFDFMIQGLANATGLLDVNGLGQVTNNATVDFDNQKITVSPLSVQFGRNFKGQLAAVVLFTIANGNGHAVRKGWLPIFEICKNLFINSLLSPPLGIMFDFDNESDQERQLPVRAKRAPGPSPHDPRSQSGAGIFSTISSYLLSPYSAEKEISRPDVTVNEEAVESSLCTLDCLASCRIGELYMELARLDLEARTEALEALRQLADRYTVERRAALLSEGSGSGYDSSGRSTPVQGGSQTHHGPLLRNNQPLPYDAAGAFVLELATNLVTSANASDSTTVWHIISEHAVSIIGAPGHFHSLQVERAVVSLLRLILYASTQSSLREKMFIALDQVNGLPVEYRTNIAAQVTAGLQAILYANPSFASSRTEWSVLLTMLAVYGNARSARAVRFSLTALAPLLSSTSEQARQERDLRVTGITKDNYAGLIALLRDFARAADTVRFESVQNGMESAQPRKTLTEKKALREYEEACQERGPGAVQALEVLRTHIPRLAHEAGETSVLKTWNTYWMPLMSAIALQYTNGHRPTRQAALGNLQRLLLAPEIFDVRPEHSEESRATVHSLFTSIVFPTLNELLKPEVFQLDPSNESGGMQETRIRSCNLLCKVYLHYLPRSTRPGTSNDAPTVSSTSDLFDTQDGSPAVRPSGQSDPIDEDFIRLWLTILDFFDRFMHSGKRDQLSEATPENLKNVLLVMNASGLLVPPPGSSSGREKDVRTQGQRILFDQTFDRIQRFLPKLQEELFPATFAVDEPVVKAKEVSEAHQTIVTGPAVAVQTDRESAQADPPRAPDESDEATEQQGVPTEM